MDSDPLTTFDPGYPAADLIIVTDDDGAPLPGQEEALAAEVRQPLAELDVLKAWAALTVPGSAHPCCCGPTGTPCLKCKVEAVLRDVWK